MYTLVVMAALTAGGEAPDFGWRTGSSCYGCYGYGCYSASSHGWGCGHSCHGCYGYSCSGCCGGYSCSGCYGSWSCWGCYGCWGTSPYFQMQQETPKMPPSDPDMKKTSVESDRARLVVEVPADAKLFIDDQPMKATSSLRSFNTPALVKGQTYYYMVRVEVAREGVTHSETRRILIRPGEEAKSSFTETSIVAASKKGATASR